MNKKAIRLKNHILSIAVLTAVMLIFIPDHSAASPVFQIDTIKQKTDTTKIIQDTIKDKAALKEARYQQRLKERAARDSIKGAKDSIRWSVPRILNTYIIDDSLRYKRLIIWNHDNYLNKINFISPDTTFNDNYNDYPFLKDDAGATYLGVAGSPSLQHNYFKRRELDIFTPFEPYLVYGFTPETLPFYNVKTPYTEFGYWGTLFANREKEESNIKILHSQNLSPSLNITFIYKRFGGKGLLGNESTDTRALAIYSNYLGRNYVMHSGFLSNSVKRDENGGILDDKMVLDTTVDDSKTLTYRLQKANNQLKGKTFFLTHSYGIPIRIFKKDTLKSGEGTTTFFGHSFEYSAYSKKYTDEIALTDTTGRKLYNNTFLLDPVATNDSIRVNNLENRFYIRLQPWAKDAIISRLDGGVGYQLLGIYNFKPEFYTDSKSNTLYNNLYLYFGADGSFKKYFRWDAFARYNISGYYENNFKFDAKAGLSLFPIKGGIHINGRVLLENRRADWLSNSFYSNHYSWENSFSNITETKIEGTVNIPDYSLKAFVGYSLINNPTYYGMQGIAAQHNGVVSILSAYIQKNFKIGFLNLNNKILYQSSSNKEIIPLPTLSLNLRYFMEFMLVKNVLTAQLGADVTFNTEYYTQAYSPALGLFHNQNGRLIGNYPYIDAFINLQWKRTSIFVKYINAAQGWPDGDYFSAHHYIRPENTIKFGIHWPFYVK
ncbi:MAG: putative porin [Bacteroidales bacterium]